MLVNEVFLVVCLYAQVSERSSSQRVGDDDASLEQSSHSKIVT